MRNLDFSSWQGLLSTLLGLALITLIGVGIRLLVMQTIQQRRARENRQINERLRTLIAAYKTLGGSFTGNLAVDPRHLRDVKRLAAAAGQGEQGSESAGWPGGERARRMRDSAEAALSDIILLGTEDQVRLAAKAASDLVAGRPVHTAELVVSLRDFIRQVLDLEPVPAQLAIPMQGPARPSSTARAKGDGGGARSGAGGQGGGGGGGGAGGGAIGIGGGAAAGAMMGADPDRDRQG
jgi:heme exporter protein D